MAVNNSQQIPGQKTYGETINSLLASTDPETIKRLSVRLFQDGSFVTECEIVDSNIVEILGLLQRFGFRKFENVAGPWRIQSVIEWISSVQDVELLNSVVNSETALHWLKTAVGFINSKPSILDPPRIDMRCLPCFDCNKYCERTNMGTDPCEA